MALLSTLVDNFDAASIDGAKWSHTDDTGASTTQSGGKLVQDVPGSATAAGYAHLRSIASYDLTGSYCYAKLVQPFQGVPAATYNWECILRVENSAGVGSIDIQWTSGDTILCRYFNNTGVETDKAEITYSATNHAWFRIREASGTFYWEAAPDSNGSPGTWVVLYSDLVTVLGWSITSVSVGFSSGTFGITTPATGPAKWDGFNTNANLSHATTGAAVGQRPAVVGSSARSHAGVTHATTGVLTGPGSNAPGSSTRFRAHATTGVLTGPGSSAPGTSARFRAHAGTGVLVGPGSSAPGSSTRFRAHAGTGVLVGPGSSAPGTAARVGGPVIHATTGVLTGPGSSAPGTAARFRAHAGTGVLVGPGSSAPGTARHNVPHATTGAASAGTASQVGSARHNQPHASTAILAGSRALLAATATHGPTVNPHTNTGALVNQRGTVVGRSARTRAGATESVQDAFDGASLNAQWTAFTGTGAGTVTQSGGKIHLNVGATVGDQATIFAAAKNLTGSYIFAKLETAIQTAGSAQGAETKLKLTDTASNNSIGWSQQSTGTIEAQWTVAGTVNIQSLPYAPATHKWLRMRESGGTLYWDYAPATSQDPPLASEWVNAFTLPVSSMGTFNLTAITPGLLTNVWGGTPGAPTVQPVWDGFNTSTRAAVTHVASGALVAKRSQAVGRGSRVVIHLTNGVLIARSAKAGSAADRAHVKNAAPVALVAGSAIIAGVSASDPSTRRVWSPVQDTAGAWGAASPSADAWTPVADKTDGWTPIP